MIVHAVICRAKDAAILVEISSPEYVGAGSNVPQVTTSLLEHLRDHPDELKEGERKSYVQRNDDNNNDEEQQQQQEMDWLSMMIESCTANTTTTTAGGYFGMTTTTTPSTTTTAASTVTSSIKNKASKNNNDKNNKKRSSTTTTTTISTNALAAPEEHFFHCWKTNGVIYCCLGDDQESRSQRVNFLFLDHIQREFTKQYSATRIAKANAYSMDKTFAKDMKSAMHYYNINHKKISLHGDGSLNSNNNATDNPKMEQVMTQVQDLKVVMGRNLHVLLRRGDHLEDLMIKSQQTQQEAQIFRKRAHELKLLQRRAATCGISTGLILLLIYVLCVGFCGFRFEYCTRSTTSSSSSSQTRDGGSSNNNNNNNNNNNGNYYYDNSNNNNNNNNGNYYDNNNDNNGN